MAFIAGTSDAAQAVVYIVAAVGGAVILGIGRAAMNLLRTNQVKRRNDESDQRSMSEFFFDTPIDLRTHTPAKQGWTTKVDEALRQLATGQAQTSRKVDELAAGQAQTARKVDEILKELKPDNNGGHNFRGIVERNTRDDNHGTT